jgi:hypothetical protein
VNILDFIRDKFIASEINPGDRRPVWCKMFIKRKMESVRSRGQNDRAI